MHVRMAVMAFEDLDPQKQSFLSCSLVFLVPSSQSVYPRDTVVQVDGETGFNTAVGSKP